MKVKGKYIMLIGVLLLITLEMYVIIFLQHKEDKSIPVISKESKVISINKIFDEISLIDGISIIESKIIDDNLVIKININGNSKEVFEKINMLNSYRVIDFKISRKEEKIDLNMDIIKK